MFLFASQTEYTIVSCLGLKVNFVNHSFPMISFHDSTANSLLYIIMTKYFYYYWLYF